MITSVKLRLPGVIKVLQGRRCMTSSNSLFKSLCAIVLVT